MTRADFTLEVGTQQDVVTVAATSPLVEFSDKVNSYVDHRRIVDLPLSGRDFNSLLGVTPGVQRLPGGGFLSVSIAGARATSNNYMVDGIPNNDRYYGESVVNQTGVLGVPATLVPMDAIAEFTVQQTPSADLQTPNYHYFHVTLQREVFTNNIVTAAYIGGRGRELNMYRGINATPLGSGGGQELRPFAAECPDLDHIIQLTNDGKSWYDSLQLSYRQSAWRGINSQYNVTLSRSVDYVSVDRGSRSSFPQASVPYDPENNKGPCDYDVRANFNAGGVYDLPPLGGVRFGSGWQVATVFTALSGRPFTPNIGGRDRSGQGIGAIRANCHGEIEYNPQDPDRYVANAAVAFSDPPPGTLGTCGRNAGRLPGLVQWDLSILKGLMLKNDVRLQFRWEVFNLLNRANFGSLQSTSVLSGSFGTIRSTPDVDATNPVLSQGGARSMQWAVKILF